MSQKTKILNAAVVVSALGYFVDIYDLVLFSIVRVASLKDIQVPEEKLLEVGVFLLNSQMVGMLIGGVLWGILGDKRGRVSVLFGSIFLYSAANILNAFVTTVPQYATLRFIAGIGLAGELGAAITLVSEVMTKETRGYGTTVVAAFGICGAILAGAIGDYFTWQTAYLIGGGLGLALLLLRMTTFESGLFHSVKEKSVGRGDITLIFKNKERMKRYIYSMLVGLPVWFVVGILITFSPELSRELGVLGDIQAGRAILFSYVGLAIGDLTSGLLSQFLKSRRKALLLFLILTALSVIIYSQSNGVSDKIFYAICVLLGFSTGYWAVFVSAASEQFGTNIRATVTTTVPNFIRGAVVPLTLGFQYLNQSVGLTLIHSAMIVGLASLLLALFSLSQLQETYAKDLDFIER
jgi:MFS transporter, putative metabolite:H+ symporter